MDFNNTIVRLLVYALPVIFAITLHEAAHGYVAKRLGDSTAYMMGRITLNPLKHIDPIGTILVPGALMLLGSSFVFGWAKPVPVNFNNLRSPKRDSLWVAIAGPLANLLQVLVWALALKVLITNSPSGMVAQFWAMVADAGITINIMFALLNLLPILPLDGGRIVASLLPGKASYAYSRSEPYGFFILLALIAFPGVLSFVLGPPYAALVDGTYQLFGLQ